VNPFYLSETLVTRKIVDSCFLKFRFDNSNTKLVTIRCRRIFFRQSRCEVMEMMLN
jgi:hypothetical protein